MITLDEAKRHLRLELDDDSQDGHLQLIVDAAIDAVQQFLDDPEPYDSSGAPPSVKAAALLIVGDLFNNREGQFVGMVPVRNQTVSNLLWPYRKGLGV